MKVYPMPLFVKAAVQYIKKSFLCYQTILQFKSIFRAHKRKGRSDDGSFTG
ncbi:hypothetical protein HPB58_15770 [Priestia filamentosa]|uniref:hypothetical protein n=1 Tax=Priestia filamentosa TaxID=1402861 RepID=UPI001FB1C72A|nr:hypothetical protein [Priestia filamentosa]UOE58787.1 hypothetical protein HPB58_15770 [Priestia filamentosa]